METQELRELMPEFEAEIRKKEVKDKSVLQYKRDIERFLKYTGENRELNRELVIGYREALLKKYKARTALMYLLTVNRILTWAGLKDCCVELPPVRKRNRLERPMDKGDYDQLIEYAKSSGNRKYYCIMKTLAWTGIRIGELQFITYEILSKKKVAIEFKNNIREVFLTDELVELLKEYAGECEITQGPLFVGRTPGKPLNISAIWKMLKKIAEECALDKNIIFPHNFRHLFARIYMKVIGNITELADLLGHRSLETTRIYTRESEHEMRRSLSVLGF